MSAASLVSTEGSHMLNEFLLVVAVDELGLEERRAEGREHDDARVHALCDRHLVQSRHVAGAGLGGPTDLCTKGDTRLGRGGGRELPRRHERVAE